MQLKHLKAGRELSTFRCFQSKDWWDIIKKVYLKNYEALAGVAQQTECGLQTKG